MRPKEDQIEEWFESPTTKYFFQLISNLVEGIDEELRDQGFDTDSCERLMAQRANLWGLKEMADQIALCFDMKSFGNLEEEDGEQVGDLSDRGPAIN